MFLDKDKLERTAWRIAACEGHIEVLHKLREWARLILTAEEINKIWF